MNNILDNKIYNTEYIEKHRLSNKKIQDAGIELLGNDEVFVQYPRWHDYYGSNYGRLISIKYEKIELLKPYISGQDNSENGYMGYRLFKVTHNKQRSLSVTCHRLVADIFLPNFWKESIGDRNKLQAHHLDHSKNNNYYKNLILLPCNLHNIMNTVKKMVVLKNGKLKTETPYQIMAETGLTLDEIILSAKGKPVKSDGKYSVFDVKGHLIGFQFFPKKKRRKKK